MKPWWKSSTIWLNAGLIAAVSVLEFLNANVPSEYAAVVGFALNIIQRFRTTTAIK